MGLGFLPSARKQFACCKLLGDQTLAQVPAAKLFWQPHSASNSIAMIVKHLGGNILSRWTDFLTADGEKAWRDREAEFAHDLTTPAEAMAR